VGPFLGAKIRDSFGAYQHAFTISAIMLLIGALLAFLLRSPSSGQNAAVMEAPEPARVPESAGHGQ
jgi:hypothetical protein